MRPSDEHDLLVDVDSLRDIQRRYADSVVETRLQSAPEIVAAVDLHIAGSTGVAVAVSMQLPDLELIETQVARDELVVPYIPGFLAFREAPVCIEAVGRLRHTPDLLLVDGHGAAHPVGAGLACHVGVDLSLPTIGVAKSRLIGHFREPSLNKGGQANLLHAGKVVGRVVRTRTDVRPVFVSVGHLITLDEAVSWTLELSRRYRLPEPAHLAHRLASEQARLMRGSAGAPT